VLQFQGEFRFLSNFWWYGDGTTVEHQYQAEKTFDPEQRELVLRCAMPGDAKRAGRFVSIRPDWEDIKIEVMLNLLRRKFAYGTALTTDLLNTRGMQLIEGNYRGDDFWGVDLNTGRGDNVLGQLLMLVRRELISN
jgi:ribA/ribD-fused uncharacterized protein